MTILEKKIQKKVDEINNLISLASNSESDNAYDGNLMVTDTSSTWEEPAIYKPIVFRNGVLYIEYFEPYSNRTKKDKILKRNLEFDGYGTLLDIAKIYRRALKKENIKYAGGGNVKPFEYKENNSTIMINGTKADVKEMYLDYKNNFLSVRKFAEHYNISETQANSIINQGRKYAKEDGYYAGGGGVTNNYVPRNSLNTITIKKGNQKLTYKISDILNGAYKLESGANLEDIAFYVPKRSIVKVQLKTGKDFKPVNGYWIKDSAKPIHVTKFDDGGSIEKSILKITPISTKRDSKGFRFYSDNTGNKLFAEKDNKIYNVNDDLKVIGEVPLQRVRFVIEGIISDEDVKNLDPLHYETKTIKRVREQFGLKNKYNEGGVMSRLLTRKKDQPKVETTDEDIDLNEDKRIRVRPSSFVRKDKEGDWMMKKNSSKEARSYAGGGKTETPTKKGKGNHKMKATTDLARKIRKDGEKWTDAIKRASLQLK